MDSSFKGRVLAIATMHRKEQVLAPFLSTTLGVTCYALSEMNTDQFGTFTEEVERNLTVIETARAKCDYAHHHFGCDLVLASEGTFGPHPATPFLPADHELLLLKDYRDNIEITGSVLSFETNHNKRQVDSYESLLDFASVIGFPSHALILRPFQNGGIAIKGVSDERVLRKSFDELMQAFGNVWAETDMRAHVNPTRLQAIRLAAEDLIKNTLSLCPSCQTPGFSVVSTEAGLPCKSCGSPTRSALRNVLTCKCCAYQAEHPYPNGHRLEDPMYCDYCNP